jgi:hypothetical protein
MRITCAVVCVMLSGCSLALKGPPRDYRPARDGPPSCNQSAGAVAVLDGLAIGIGLMPTAVVAALNVGEEPHDLQRQIGWVLPGAVLATVAALAMGYGRCATALCEKANLDFLRWSAAGADRRASPSESR